MWFLPALSSSFTSHSKHCITPEHASFYTCIYRSLCGSGFTFCALGDLVLQDSTTRLLPLCRTMQSPFPCCCSSHTALYLPTSFLPHSLSSTRPVSLPWWLKEYVEWRLVKFLSSPLPWRREKTKGEGCRGSSPWAHGWSICPWPALLSPKRPHGQGQCPGRAGGPH